MNKKIFSLLFLFAVLLTACGTNEQASAASLSTDTSPIGSSASSALPAASDTLATSEPVPIHFPDAGITFDDFLAPYTALFVESFPNATITQLRWQFFEVSEKNTFVIRAIDGDNYVSEKYIFTDHPIVMGTDVVPFTEEKKNSIGYPQTPIDTTGILSPSQVEQIINDTYGQELTEIILEVNQDRQVLIVLFRDQKKTHYKVAMDSITGEILTEYFPKGMEMN